MKKDNVQTRKRKQNKHDLHDHGLLGASGFPVKMESMAMSSLPSSMGSSLAWPNSYWQSFQQSQAMAASYSPYSAAYSQYYGQTPSAAVSASSLPTNPSAAAAYGAGAY